MTDIDADGFEAHLIERKYADGTMKKLMRPIRFACENRITWSELQSIPTEDLYRLINGRGGTRRTINATAAGLNAYRDYLDYLERHGL